MYEMEMRSRLPEAKRGRDRPSQRGRRKMVRLGCIEIGSKTVKVENAAAHLVGG
jgi:hypothetical protein